jgi:restriction system protein
MSKTPNISRQRTGKLMRTLFEILLENPDGIQARDAIAELEKRVPPTEYEQGSFPSGGRRYEKIARFATVDLTKAAWMQKSKGIWSPTEAGRDAYEALTDPTEFYRLAVQLYNEWKAAQPGGEPASETKPDEAESAPSQTFEEAEEAAWSEIWDYLRRIDPYELQRLVELWIEYMDRIGEDARQLLPLKPIWFLAPRD